MKAFQPVPLILQWQPKPGVQDTNFVQRVAGTSEVARCASKDQVVQLVSATTGVRNDVIVLSPHCLKCGMLVDLFIAPIYGSRISITHSLACLASNNRHAAETAVVAVSMVYLRLDSRTRHSLFYAKLLDERRLGRSKANVNFAIRPD